MLKPMAAQAANSMKVVDFNDTKAKKIGDYYFKVNGESDRYVVRMSTEKSSGYKKIKLSAPMVVDGKVAYGMNGNYLYKMNLKTKEYTKLKSFAKYLKVKYSEKPYINVAAGEYGYIYLNWSSFDDWENRVYQYNIKAKTLKKIGNTQIAARNGDYVISNDEFRTDVSPYSITLWQYTKSGLKKVKNLTKNGHGATKVGKYFYYANYPNKEYGYASMKTAEIIRINKDGSGKKKIGTIKCNGEYGEVIPYDFTSDHCSVHMSDGTYTYTYKTKKLTLQ